MVLDASAVVELLLGTRRGASVSREIASTAISLHVPHLLDVEVTQAIRRLEHAKVISEARGRTALAVLRVLDLQWHPHQGLTERAWQLRHNVTAYDGVYLALAEAVRCPLLTADHALVTVPGHSAEVRVV